ncbi:MAG: O-antigen ligase family protein [Thermoanaerobaculia bacterium]
MSAKTRDRRTPSKVRAGTSGRLPAESRGRSGRPVDVQSAPPRGLAALGHRLAIWTVWLLLVAVPVVLDSAQKDSFRLPKSLLGETLALVSLFFLALAWKGPDSWRRLARAPFVRMWGPFLVVATLLSLASPHTAHVHRGLAGLWIGALAVWGWSAGFSRAELREALNFSLVPASILALIGILQFHGLYEPYAFAGIAETSRFAIGSLAGNVGDLAAALVLPVILAQSLIVRGRRLALACGALAVCLYGLVVTQTFAAVAAAAAGTCMFWAFRVSRKRAAAAVAAVAGTVVLMLVLIGPFRERSLAKLAEVGRGDWNTVLTGRLDGWRAAVWMLEQHPLRGVGVGAYRTEYIYAKAELLRHGVTFFADQMNVVFANAHNEFLEVAAETGLPGLAAFLWGSVLLVRRLRGRRRTEHREGASGADSGASGSVSESAAPRAAPDPDRALAWAGTVAIAVLSLANFPFRIAISLWPILLFLAWILTDEKEVA